MLLEGLLRLPVLRGPLGRHFNTRGSWEPAKVATLRRYSVALHVFKIRDAQSAGLLAGVAMVQAGLFSQQFSCF
jgi:hypothetical protein